MSILVILLIPVVSTGMSLPQSETSTSLLMTKLSQDQEKQLETLISRILMNNGESSTGTKFSTSRSVTTESYLLEFATMKERASFVKAINDVLGSSSPKLRIEHAYKHFPVLLVKASPQLVFQLEEQVHDILSVANNRPVQMVFDPRSITTQASSRQPSHAKSLATGSISSDLDNKREGDSFFGQIGLQQLGSQLDLDTIPAQVTNATALWNLGYKGSGVRIAIADTGIWNGHPDLTVAAIRNYVNSTYGYDFPEDSNDGHGHGTHVAGIAVGTGAASNGKYIGMAPEATLYSFKVATTFGSATPAGILAAIDDAIELKVDVLSMSLGFNGGNADDIISRAVDEAVESGVVVTVSAGNSGPSYFSISSPATARKAIAVGATNYDYQVVDFSSRGPTPDGRVAPDVLAPGFYVISTLAQGSVLDEALNAIERYDGIIPGNGGDYVPLSGTSMAAPVVAGAVALLKQAFPQAKPLEIKAAIEASAKKIEHVQGIYATGSGFLDVFAAYNYLKEKQGQIVSIEPQNIEYVDPPRFTGEHDSITLSIMASQPRDFNLKVTGNISSFVDIPTSIELDTAGYGEIPVNISIPFSANSGTYVGKIEVLTSGQQVVVSIPFDPIVVQHPRARILWDLWHNDFSDSIYINFHELANFLEEELGYSLVLWDQPWNLHDLLQFDLIILPDPEIALTPHDQAVLSDYLFLGGNIVFLASYGPNYEVNSLNEFLNAVGIQFSSSLLPSVVDQGISVEFSETEVGTATLNASYFSDVSFNLSWPLGSKIAVTPREGVSVGAYITYPANSNVKVPVLVQANLSAFSEYPFQLSSIVQQHLSATRPGKIVVLASELIWYDWHWLSQDTTAHREFTRGVLNWVLKPNVNHSVTLATSTNKTDWNSVGLQVQLNTTVVLSNQTVFVTARIFDLNSNSYSDSLPSELRLLVVNQSNEVILDDTVNVNSEGIATMPIDASQLPMGWYVIGVAVNNSQNAMMVQGQQLMFVKNVPSQEESLITSKVSRITGQVSGDGTTTPADWVSTIGDEELLTDGEIVALYKNQHVTFGITINASSRFNGINAVVFEIGEGLSSLIVRNVSSFVSFEELAVTERNSGTATTKTYEASWAPSSRSHQGLYLLLIEVLEDWNGAIVVSDQQGFTFFLYEDQPSISSHSSYFNENPLSSLSTSDSVRVLQVSLGQEIEVRLSGEDPTDALEQMNAHILLIHYYFFIMTGVILEAQQLTYSSTLNAFVGSITMPNQQSFPISSDSQQLRLKTGSNQIYAAIYVLRDSQGNYDLEVVAFVIQGSLVSLGSTFGLVIILLLIIILGAIFVYFWQRSRKTATRPPTYPPYTSYQQFYQPPPTQPPPHDITQPSTSGSISEQGMDEGVDLRPEASSMKRFCRYCGFPVRSEDVFCGNCGRRL